MTNRFVEILCVGNELLIGKTVNTNAHWLAKRVTNLGLIVRRVTIVGDDLDEIATATTETIRRKPIFIITTGGLGPTFDDKTAEGIAVALGRPLEENEEALKMIKKRYERYVAEGRAEKIEMTPPKVKMARLPKGATPLPNPVGTAPGVLVEQEDVSLVLLPGVPEEMMTIFDESVVPLLRKIGGNLTFFEASLDVWGIPESDLAPIIDKVMHDGPYVYIKSHPKTVEKGHHCELHLSTTAKDSSQARQRIGQSIAQISEIIKDKGGRVQPSKAS